MAEIIEVVLTSISNMLRVWVGITLTVLLMLVCLYKLECNKSK